MSETAPPPVLREKRIGKETADRVPENLSLVVSHWSLAKAQRQVLTINDQRPNDLPLTDKFGRTITDLRIAITDHCNYKCVYCRTGNDGAQYADLPFADYVRMARVFAGLGIEKVRI